MKEWTEEEETELRRMLADGLSRAQIGRKLGRSRCSVTGKINRMGLTESPTGPRDRTVERRQASWDAELKGWDSRTFLPYAEWRKWHRNRLKERENA